ncbi:MAG: DUF2207 domain-containing protein [Muribaculaceae bacterium]|nr:DUF2207 domain-containing protein [Muribaculaceae bacterium]
MNARLRYSLLFVLAFIAFASASAQHRLVNLDIKVLINNYGNARVVETRTMEIDEDEGTESFIKMYNMNGMEVGELSVSDETGTEYKVESDWNVKRSRLQKTNRCGYNHTDEGEELCWGIGEAGHRVYTVRYTLTRLVKSYDDFDGFNFMFYESDSPYAEHVKVTIERENDAPFLPESTRIWAFRYRGDIMLDDGHIVAETDEPMVDKGEGVIVMAVFNKGVFYPVTRAQGSIVKMLIEPAFEGSDYSMSDCEDMLAAMKNGKLLPQEDNNLAATSSLMGSNNLMDKKTTIWEKLFDLVRPFLLLGAMILLMLVLIIGITNIFNTFSREKNLKRLFGNNRHEVQVWNRDIPFEGDLNHSYSVLEAVEPNDAENSNRIAACVMRMLYNGAVKLQSVIDKKGNLCQMLEIVEPPEQCPYEKTDKGNVLMYFLQRLMYDSAGSDHVLQPNELGNYMKSKPVENRPVVKVLYSLMESSKIRLKDVTVGEAEQVFGLKKFLQEFTLLNERTVKEASLWKEYLVHATLFGIADQVRADMKKIWPEYVEIDPIAAQLESTPTLCSTVGQSAIMGMSFVRNFETPAERSARLQRERSSGGGGRSSRGGGGGHSGGGGSGVR